MLAAIAELLGPGSAVPQGYCLLWHPGLVMLHAVSDGVIALAFIVLPAGLWHFARRRTDLEFRGVYLMFAAFIFACGLVHLLMLIALWFPLYGVEGVLKAITAALAVGTAYALWRTIPLALATPSLASLRLNNRTMVRAVADRDALVAARSTELAAALRELDSFAHMIAHDLRAPLAGIGASVKMLADEHGAKLDAAGHELLERTRLASAKSCAVIEEMLHMARLTRVPLQIMSVDLSALAGGVVKELRAAEPDRNIDVRLATGAVIDCDPDLMRIALAHLFRNAWTFTARQANAKIEFGYQRRGGKTIFYIRDNGVGFDMEDADALFQPFQRLHAESGYSGDGIGLAVVARIIHRHGGDIKAEASLGKGTSLMFTL